jgi:hypothetical protein
VDFYDGYVGYHDFRYYDYSVRLVRGGQSFDNLGVSGHPATVKFTAETETLRDGIYQVGAALKTWTFKNGATAISGLKALPVSGKTDAGLGITATQVVVGDVAANANFTVSLPIAPVHAGAALKASYWTLVDGSGAPIKISNSQSGQFWLKLRTNLAPTFSPLQLDSVGARVGETVSIALLTRDGDGDPLTFTASSGSVSNGLWSGSFATPGVKPVTITVSDGLEIARKTMSVVVRDAAGVARDFSDVLPDSAASVCDPAGTLAGPDLVKDYDVIEYLVLRGVVIGLSDGPERKFEPCRYATQAEALKMLMQAARARNGLVFNEASRPLNNLIVEDAANGVFINASWAAPYVLKAEALGIISSAEAFSPQLPATRAWLARAVARLQALVVPVDAFSATQSSYQFPDQASFANAQDYNDALATAFFGYLGQLTVAFNPRAAMSRADVARVASRLLRAPSADDVTLDGTTPATVDGRSLPAVTQGSNFRVKGLLNLSGQRILRSGDRIMEEWIDSPANYVDATIIKVGSGIVAGGAKVRVKNLATAPVTVSTATPPILRNEIRNLLVLLEDVDSGVRAVLRKDYAVLFPDRDGDGVRDEVDLWPDSPLFSSDANANGIPDNADAAFGLAARQGSDAITINGAPTTIIAALLAGQFGELALALAPKASSSTVLTASPVSPALAGQATTLTVSVSGAAGTPTGSVLLAEGGTPLGTLTLSASGSATYAGNFGIGPHSLSASYAGDTAYLASQGSLSYLVASSIASTLGVRSSPNPSQPGQSVSVTVKVTPASNVGAISGTVSVSGDGQSCRITLPATGCTLVFASKGAKKLAATYSGNSVYAASSSSATHFVGQRPSLTPILLLLLD